MPEERKKEYAADHRIQFKPEKCTMVCGYPEWGHEKRDEQKRDGSVIRLADRAELQRKRRQKLIC